MKSSQIIEVEDDDWAMGLSDESEIEDSIERDPDWVKTPVQRRSDRRTRSTETSSLSLLSDSGRVQVREKHWSMSYSECKINNNSSFGDKLFLFLFLKLVQ